MINENDNKLPDYTKIMANTVKNMQEISVKLTPVLITAMKKATEAMTRMSREVYKIFYEND